ncbi:MAG: N-acetyltransferase [Abditibacteriota bacterium]|nr:N-acetyltransferase [Abditibacteriota bacterium]
MTTTADYVIRPERREEYRETETLVREAFWNVYRPGCLEHFVLHTMRSDPAFVPELDLVMEQEGRLIGQNMFARTVIDTDGGGALEVLTMGPICIAPELQRRGLGKALLDASLEKAAALGFGAVLFEGNIGFYGKSGFVCASRFGVRYNDMPADADTSFFLCKELREGYLEGVTGAYRTPPGYLVDRGETEEFDRLFAPRIKQKLPGQLFPDDE